MKTTHKHLLFLIMFITSVQLVFSSCKRDEEITNTVYGYEFLNKIPGLWHGPVTSSTSAGNFDQWYIDFRPVSSAQVSQFSLLDTNTVNNLSFFIVKFNNRLTIAMRSEGCFMNSCCVTYEVMDSVASNYFRFSDFVKGTKRAYTEFIFKEDSVTMKVYTSKFNTVDPVQLHTTWTAVLGSRNNTTAATAHFNYPQPVMVKDFSNAFSGMAESIFFTFENDPYQSVTQPYVGSATVNISIDSAMVTDTSDQIFLLFTTEPLFNGLVYVDDNLKYTSKYVFLSAATPQYKIKNIHPGTYYIYSLIDKNDDHLYLSGDYMSSNFTNSFTVQDQQDVSVSTVIDYLIP